MTLILLAVAYLVGSVPFGLWLTRVQGLDLRSTGSGNIGATNVWRAAGRLMAAVVLALDAAKGAFAVLLARVVVDEPWVMAGCAVAVVVGHIWPVFAGFRGGKGVATTAGAYASLVPVIVVWPLVAFACVLAMTRYVSVASMAAAVALPFVALMVDGRASITVGAFVLAALVLWRHQPNVARLNRGTEPKIRVRDVQRRAPFVA